MLALAFSGEIASLLNYPEHSEYIVWLAIILGIDAFTAIPFARLRLNNRPIKFAVIKVIGIVSVSYTHLDVYKRQFRDSEK